MRIHLSPCPLPGRMLAVVITVLTFVFAAHPEARGGESFLAGLGVLPTAGPFTLGGSVRIDPFTGSGVPSGRWYMFEFDGIGLNLSSDSHGRVYNVGNVVLSDRDTLNIVNATSGEFFATKLLSGRPHGFLWPSAIAFDSDDTLYSILPPESGYAQKLATIDMTAGTYREVVTLNNNAPVIVDAAFDVHDRLYALGRDVGLVRIDVVTGTTQVIGGDLATMYANSLEFAADGRLLATAQGQLWSVDPATGSTTEIGPISAPYSFFGLAATTTNGDFNTDGSWNCLDVDALVAEIATTTHDPAFDLTGDGFVDHADLDEWLLVGGANHAAATGGNPFRYGDANLDGVVDVSDFNLWNTSKFTATPAWCAGDFTADGVVDGSDFNVWNTNKFTTSADPRAVPEPTGLLVLVFTLVGIWWQVRRTRR